MIDYLLNLDRTVTVAINSAHSPFWDNVMLGLTHKWNLVPIYLLLLFYIICRKQFMIRGAEYRNNWLVSFIIIGACFLAFGITDQIGHCIFKPEIQRLRPGYDFYIWDLVSTPDGKGGLYGFVSNHAANISGFTFVALLFIRRKFIFIMLSIVALGVCYSRIYLARHFAGDVVCGMAFGALAGWLAFLFGSVMIKFLSSKNLVTKIQ